MNKHEKAIADLKKFRAMFGGVLDLADAMEGVGSVEQAAEEAKARLNATRADEAKAKQDLAGAQAAVEKQMAAARVKVMGELAAMHEDGRKAMQAAREQAAAKLSEAEHTAVNRTSEHLAVLQSMENKIAAKSRELDMLTSTVNAKHAAHAVLERALAIKQAAHDEVVKALAAMKARL